MARQIGVLDAGATANLRGRIATVAVQLLFTRDDVGAPLPFPFPIRRGRARARTRAALALSFRLRRGLCAVAVVGDVPRDVLVPCAVAV